MDGLAISGSYGARQPGSERKRTGRTATAVPACHNPETGPSLPYERRRRDRGERMSIHPIRSETDDRNALRELSDRFDDEPEPARRTAITSRSC